MSDSRSRARDSTDDETDHTSRNVRPRHSPIPGDPYLGEPSSRAAVSDSDEEPFEDPEDSPPTIHRTPSPLPPASPPSPIASPSPLPSAAPPSPIAPPSPVLPSLRFSSRNQGTVLRWDWMPISLRAWRNAEQLPVIPMPIGLHTPTLTLTREPIHHTIPVLVARLRTHDEQLEQIERSLGTPTHEVAELQQQIMGVESDLSELKDEVVDTHTRGEIAREEIATLRQQVATLQQEVAELRAEREQFKADAASSARMCELIGAMGESLLR